MAVTEAGGTARSRPRSSRAAPTPPASATTFIGGSGYRRLEGVALAPERLELLDPLRQPLRDLPELGLLPERDGIAGGRVADPGRERVLVGGDRRRELGDPQLDLRQPLARAAGRRAG